MEYRIGDRVWDRIFKSGTIINITGGQILVEFDEKRSMLHNGNGVGNVIGKPNHCWWCFPRDLKIIEGRKTILTKYEEEE